MTDRRLIGIYVPQVVSVILNIWTYLFLPKNTNIYVPIGMLPYVLAKL